MRRGHIANNIIPPLPVGYTNLKWLESISSGAVINCNFYFNVNWKISGEFSFTDNIGSNFASVCGSDWYNSGGSGSRQGHVLFSPSLSRCDTVFGEYRASILSTQYTYSDIIHFEVTKNQLVVEEEYFTDLSFSGTVNDRYFKMFQFDRNSRIPYLRLYHLDIKDQYENIIHDFYPAMRDSDSKLGMYDIAANYFYTTTGNFNYEAL